MIPELRMYRITFYVMAAATVGFLAWVARFPKGKRRYYLPLPILCGILSLAYFGMSVGFSELTTPTGQPVQTSRYVDYFISGPMMVTIAGIVAGASRRQLVGLNVVMISWTGSIFAGYFLTEPAVYAANIANFVLLGVLAYLLIWPITSRSGEQSGERVLLYGKLRNLLLILFGAYLVLGLLSRQGFGLLDAFTGIFTGSYLDALTRVGFCTLVLRATDATDQIIESIESGGADDGSDGVTLERSDDSAVDPAD
ncbi:bacteriorhodopsin [Natrinema salsiterrestre]|uniref:Bacteriorhodopsin n=1 Tax=Natrinema salsiterrestre TaxID=2950540 RepID=A0A9Q4L4J7_9EURY|nr:bacteriorhodopsin [Natrinema salsiterrestre]MDF9747199.1 bacteriorhodopsin [Natrinema salsiterrestre]